jgi:Flp pilus assembly protein TadD
VAYAKSGHTEDAIVAYRQAIKFKLDDAEAWYNLGVANRAVGQESQAADAFERARKLRPDLFK